MSNADRNTVVVFVVDDQLNDEGPTDRMETYKACWSLLSESLKGRWQFDVRYFDRPGAVVSTVLSPGQPALAVVDMVLDTEPWSNTVVAQFYEWLLNQRMPTVLVSQHFHEATALGRANKLTVELARKQVPFQFMLWQTIVAASGDKVIAEQLAFPIGSMLSLAHGRDQLFEKESGESVRMLHITDPHFGIASWDAGALAVLRGRFRDLKLLEADFLAITGDVANHGAPSEYMLAREYFHALAHNGLITAGAAALPPERIFMVPGNHDYSRPVALAANVQLDSKNIYSLAIRPEPNSEWIRLLARAPYEKFENDLARRERPWTPSPGYRIDNRFITAGILFLELDLERNMIEGYQVGTEDSEIQTRLNEASKAIKNARRMGECVAVLAHRHVNDAWTKLDAMLKNFFGGLAIEGPVMLLCGHEHDAKIASEYAKKLLLVRGVPAVSGPGLPPGNLPKLHYIELKREKGKVIGAVVYTFHQSVGEWLDSGKECEFLWTAEKGWS